MKKLLSLAAVAVCFVVLSGCRPAPTTPADGDGQQDDSGAASEDNGAAPEQGAGGSEADEPNDDSADAGTGEGQPDDPSPAAEEKTNQVTLGDPSLTAGIPGEGPLTTDQISAWLADEANHETLEISLPRGIAAASAQIQGIQDNPMTRAKIELGRQLYFDRRLSADSTVSCADCHHPDEGFTRHTQFGIGIGGQEGNRNSPVAYNRILSDEQFWDGRAESLEAQAIGPIANPIEMGNTHQACEECVEGIPGYKMQFDKIFEDGVTIENIGKAIATFERAIVTGPSPYDYWEPLRTFRERYKQDLEDIELLKEEDPDFYQRYQDLVAASEAHPFSEAAERGRQIFFSEKGNCTACHAGANFTDEQYHNLGVGMDVETPDLGRYEVSKEEKDKGAFKTPTIRNVALSHPYMHDGSQKTLEEVVAWYAKGGHPNPYLSDKMKKLDLTEQDKKDLVEFMKALTGEFPPIERERLPE